MLLFQPAVECVRMKVPEMMTPACVTVQMATVETTVKVSPYVREKQAPSEMLQKHSYVGKTAAEGQRCDIY